MPRNLSTPFEVAPRTAPLSVGTTVGALAEAVAGSSPTTARDMTNAPPRTVRILLAVMDENLSGRVPATAARPAPLVVGGRSRAWAGPASDAARHPVDGASRAVSA